MPHVITELVKLHYAPVQAVPAVAALLSKRAIAADLNFLFEELAGPDSNIYNLPFVAVEDVLNKSGQEGFDLTQALGVYSVASIGFEVQGQALLFKTQKRVAGIEYGIECSWSEAGRIISLSVDSEVSVRTNKRADNTSSTVIYSKENKCRINIQNDATVLATTYSDEDMTVIEKLIAKDKTYLGVYTAVINNRIFALMHDESGFNPFEGFVTLTQDVFGKEPLDITPQAGEALSASLNAVATLASCHFGATEYDDFVKFANSLVEVAVKRSTQINSIVLAYEKEQREAQEAKAKEEQVMQQAGENNEALITMLRGITREQYPDASEQEIEAMVQAEVQAGRQAVRQALNSPEKEFVVTATDSEGNKIVDERATGQMPDLTGVNTTSAADVSDALGVTYGVMPTGSAE